jgi:hypothetical protein
MAAITRSRATPAFTVRMTITPVVVGEKAWAWAADEVVMVVAPVRFMGVQDVAGRDIGVAPDLPAGFRPLPVSHYPR